MEKKIALFISIVALCVGLSVGMGVSLTATELLKRSATNWLYDGDSLALVPTGPARAFGNSSREGERSELDVRPHPRTPASISGSSAQSVAYHSIGLSGLTDLSTENSAPYMRVTNYRLGAYLDRLQLSATLIIGLAGVLSALFAIAGARWLTRNHEAGQLNPTSAPPGDTPPGAPRQSCGLQSEKVGSRIPHVGLFRRLWRQIPDPVIVFNDDYKVEILNRRAELMFGRASSEARGLGIRTLLMPTKPISRDRWLEYLRHPTDNGDDLEIIAVRKNGLQIPVAIAVETVEYSGWKAYTTIVRDISAQKQREARLQLLVDTDALTGVASRRRYLADSQREFRAAKRYAKPLSVLVFDIDRFKAINDRYGHATGDRVLLHVTEACRHILRTPDALGRLGGDEFAITMPETDQIGAQEVAYRLLRAIRQLRFPDGDGADLPNVTVSVGLASMDQKIGHFDDLLHSSDLFLCIAKRNGRNQIAPEMRPRNIELAGRTTVVASLIPRAG